MLLSKYSTSLFWNMSPQKKNHSRGRNQHIVFHFGGIHQAAIYAIFYLPFRINSSFIYSKFTTVNLHTKIAHIYANLDFLCAAIGSVKWILPAIISHLLSDEKKKKIVNMPKICVRNGKMVTCRYGDRKGANKKVMVCSVWAKHVCDDSRRKYTFY